MGRAFFHKEQKAVFVVASLAIWFALLAQFGPYLPANAMAQNKQLAVNLNGQQITGEWSRKKGRWIFQKVVSVRKLNIQAFSKEAVSSNRTVDQARSTVKKTSLGARLARRSVASVSAKLPMSQRPVSEAPATTASVPWAKAAESANKIAARAIRSKLAEEIGRWAKIGDRWEWQKGTSSAKAFTSPQDELISEYSKWQLHGGFWVFDENIKEELFLKI